MNPLMQSLPESAINASKCLFVELCSNLCVQQRREEKRAKAPTLAELPDFPAIDRLTDRQTDRQSLID